MLSLWIDQHLLMSQCLVKKKTILGDSHYSKNKMKSRSFLPLKNMAEWQALVYKQNLYQARTWDYGSKSVREIILLEFMDRSRNKSAKQIDFEMANGSSLFFIRLSAWLKTSYLEEKNIVLLIKALDIFISAPESNKFLVDFVERGTLLATLDMLGLSNIDEESKRASLVLLTNFCQKGRNFKELICHAQGLSRICDVLERSEKEETMKEIRNVLVELSTSNPKYQNFIHKILTTHLSSLSNKKNVIYVSQAIRGNISKISTITNSVRK